jgi:crossover junction endodeoxyribonuclease RuvC
MRLLGLDPGLRHTGWGVIEANGNRLTHIADGVVHSDGKQSLAERLVALFRQLNEILDRYQPDEAAVEETFVNKNPSSTLKLGVARGVVLLAPAERGIPVAEYSTNLIKKSVVGVGHAEKAQVQMMVRRLLPGCVSASPDAADALAVAICHAHHAATMRVWQPKMPLSSERPKLLSPRGEEGARATAREGEGDVQFARSLISEDRASAITPSPRSSPRRGEEAVGRPLDEIRALQAKSKPTPVATARARKLRQNSTEVEKRLWHRLRAGQIEGMKFRRQEPILGFTVDFVCHAHRLIVELDGGQHAAATVIDERRTKLLSQAGFRVLRFWNNDVVENLDGVLATISNAVIEARP